MNESRPVPATYQISDDRQKVFALLPIPRPKIRAMRQEEALAADMGPHPVDGQTPWSDLPCLWCDKTPTHPYQIDVFRLCHCGWQCASKTLLWLRSVEDERTLRESLGLADDVDLGLKPDPEPTYEPGGGLVGGNLNVTFNLDGTPKGGMPPRPPKPGDTITLMDGTTGVVIQDEGNGKLTVQRVDRRMTRDEAREKLKGIRGVTTSMVIMDEAHEGEADRLKAESLERQRIAARQIRRDRRSGF